MDGDHAAVAVLAAADTGSLGAASCGDCAAVDSDRTALVVAVLLASADTGAGLAAGRVDGTAVDLDALKAGAALAGADSGVFAAAVRLDVAALDDDRAAGCLVQSADRRAVAALRDQLAAVAALTVDGQRSALTDNDTLVGCQRGVIAEQQVDVARYSDATVEGQLTRSDVPHTAAVERGGGRVHHLMIVRDCSCGFRDGSVCPCSFNISKPVSLFRAGAKGYDRKQTAYHQQRQQYAHRFFDYLHKNSPIFLLTDHLGVMRTLVLPSSPS